MAYVQCMCSRMQLVGGMVMLPRTSLSLSSPSELQIQKVRVFNIGLVLVSH